MVDDLRYRIDVNSLHRDQDAAELGLNEIGRVRAAHERAAAARSVRPVAHDGRLHPDRRGDHSTQSARAWSSRPGPSSSSVLDDETSGGRGRLESRPWHSGAVRSTRDPTRALLWLSSWIAIGDPSGPTTATAATPSRYLRRARLRTRSGIASPRISRAAPSSRTGRCERRHDPCRCRRATRDGARRLTATGSRGRRGRCRGHGRRGRPGVARFHGRGSAATARSTSQLRRSSSPPSTPAPPAPRRRRGASRSACGSDGALSPPRDALRLRDAAEPHARRAHSKLTTATAAAPGGRRRLPPLCRRAGGHPHRAGACSDAIQPMPDRRSTSARLRKTAAVPGIPRWSLVASSRRPSAQPPRRPRDDVVPSWELTDRYGAQGRRRVGWRRHVRQAVHDRLPWLLILALGVAAVLPVPGLLGGNATEPLLARRSLPAPHARRWPRCAVGPLVTPTQSRPTPPSVEPTRRRRRPRRRRVSTGSSRATRWPRSVDNFASPWPTSSPPIRRSPTRTTSKSASSSSSRSERRPSNATGVLRSPMA